MTTTIHPIAAVAGSPAFNGRMLRQVGSVNKAMATTARPLGARSGVRRGTPDTTCSATSTTWTIGPHAGTLDLQVAAEAGAYDYALDAAITGPMVAAHATLPRTDLLWMRADDPPEDGAPLPAAVGGYTVNPTPNTGLPPATPARCMVLGWVNVPSAASGNAPTVTFKAPFVVAAGAPVPVRNVAERDAVGASDGTYVDQADTRRLQRSSGGAWEFPGMPVLGVAGAVSGSPVAGRVQMQAGRVVALTDGSGRYLLTFPTPFPGGLIDVFTTLSDASLPLHRWVVDSAFGANGSIAWMKLVNTSTGAAIVTANSPLSWLAVGF